MRTSCARQPASNRAKLVLLLALLISCLLSGCADGERLEIDNARVRSLIPGQDKTVAYLDVHNGTHAPVSLVGATSDQVRAIEFHTTRMDDGVMRMRRLSEVTIEAGATVQFQPGGRHLMLFGVRSLGPRLQIELRFADGTITRVPFERIAIGAQ